MDGTVLASLDREELLRYRWWWRKYVILKYAAALAYLAAFADLLWHHLRIPHDLLYPLLIVAGFVFTMWRGLLDCPDVERDFIPLRPGESAGTAG